MCFRILHITCIYIYITPVKKKSDVFWKKFIIVKKDDNIFMVNTTQKYYYKNKEMIFTLYVNITISIYPSFKMIILNYPLKNNSQCILMTYITYLHFKIISILNCYTKFSYDTHL